MAAQKSYSLPSFMNSDSSLPWLLPLITMLIVFAIIPFFYNIYLSFHEFVPAKRALLFVGWDNWIRLFTDGVFWGSLKVSLYYTFMCLLIQLILGMGIALLIDSDDPGFGIIRSILTLTLVIPPAIAGMIFLIMEDANYGLIPWLLKSVGLIGPEDTILADPTLALWGVMIVDIWQWTPFMVLILVAGLRSLPSEPFESAVIDGARPFQVFRRLTLPMLHKVIAVAILIRGIDLWRMVDYVFVLTSGGPGTATYTLSLYSWQRFTFVQWGYGATISLFSLIVILIVGNAFIHFAKVKW